jgi:hypothetical protein
VHLFLDLIEDNFEGNQQSKQQYEVLQHRLQRNFFAIFQNKESERGKMILD